MKIKLIISFSIISLFYIQMGKAQQYEFAPIGATWYYSLADYSIPEPYRIYEYIKIVSIGDTVIEDKTCRILQEYSTSFFPSQSHYIYSDSNRVYYYDFYNEIFDLLYDFNKIQGENWLSYTWGDSPDCDTVFVNSVDTIEINGHYLKSLYISQEYCLGGFLECSYPIIEVIGHTFYLFPIGDNPYEGPLRCYEDSIIGLYDTGIAPACDYIGTLFINKNEFKQNEMSVFPNPTDGNYININFSNTFTGHISLYSMDGKLIYKQAITTPVLQTTISLPNLNAGLYFIKTESFENQVNFSKIIIK